MASPPPPPPLDSGYHVGDRLDAYSLAPVGVLLGIASITTGLRIYWRTKPTWRIGVDDYALIFALVLTIAWYAVDGAMYHHGRGLEGFKPDPWTMGPLIAADGVLWVWAMNVIRVAIALMLLRLKDSRPWRITLWTVVAVQGLMLVVGTTMHLVMCRPITARWAPTPEAECIPPDRFIIYGYVYSGFTIASDLILSLLPVTFILHLRRPLHEKILIGCLMGAGLASTGVAVARLFLIMGYIGKGGPRINMTQDLLWGFELTLGILAASVPTLKAPIHHRLMRWGLLRDQSVSDVSPESFVDQTTNGSHFTRQMRKWDTMDDDSRKRPFMYTVPQKSDGSGTEIDDSPGRLETNV